MRDCQPATLVVSTPQDKGWGAEEVLEHLLYEGLPVCVAAAQTSRFPDIVSKTGQPFAELHKSRDAFLSNVSSALKFRLPTGIRHIHAWCTRSLETAFLLSQRHRLPLTVGLHDSPSQDYHGIFRRLLIHSVCHRATAVATVSQAMAAQCRSLGLHSDPVVIYNGIPDLPLPRRSLAKGAKPIVGFLGMNAPRKGFENVVSWIGKVDCEWNLYGEIAQESRKSFEKVKTLHPHLVHFLGRKPVREIFEEIDIVVMPAYEFEPFGLVAVEAGRAALPVVASAAGGPEEIVNHERTGFLYPCTEPDQGLAYLQRLCKDTYLRQSMGAAGRECFLTHFRADRMCREWTNFFAGISQ